ncbi:MAG: MarR family transcriptional regulator [Firmicutes bacterium]|nr:MarR family transcriptional regulator [Bacillota bacterium]
MKESSTKCCICDPGQMELGRLIGLIHNSMHRRMMQSSVHSEAEGATGKNGWIIGFLAGSRGKPVYQKDIEKEFNVTRSTASKVLSLMERKGIIERKAVEGDGRLKEILLTEKGNALVQRMEEDIRETEEVLCKGFTEEERVQLLSYLFRVFENVNSEKGGKNT